MKTHAVGGSGGDRNRPGRPWLRAIAMPERSGLPWRDDVTAWTGQHQAGIGNGMALAGMLWGQLERWDAKRGALLRADRPAGTIGQLGWTRSRRAYELAQTGFLSNGPDRQVLRWGRAAHVGRAKAQARRWARS